jgi:hypothetical protein
MDRARVRGRVPAAEEGRKKERQKGRDEEGGKRDAEDCGEDRSKEEGEARSRMTLAARSISIALAVCIAACGAGTAPAGGTAVAPAPLVLPPAASAAATAAPARAHCVPQERSLLTHAVDDFLSEGQLSSAVDKTLEAQRKDPRDLAPERLRRAESHLAAELVAETVRLLAENGMVTLAQAAPFPTNVPPPPPTGHVAALMNATFGGPAPKIRTETISLDASGAANNVYAEHDLHSLRDTALIDPGIPRDLNGARLARAFFHGDHTVATYWSGVDLSTIVVSREGAKPRGYSFGPQRDLDIEDARLVDRVLVVTFAYNAYAPSAIMRSSFIVAYDADTGQVIHATSTWPRLTRAFVDYGGALGANGAPKPPALEETDALLSHTGDDDRCWAEHAIVALSKRDATAMRAAVGNFTGTARALVALNAELLEASNEIATRPKELDLSRARLVAVTSSPDRAVVNHATNPLPAKARTLREKSKQKIDDPTKTPPTTYDPRYPFDTSQKTELPSGARPDIPLSFGGRRLAFISESNGKLLLSYGERYVAVVSGTNVDYVLDTNPEGLLKGDDQWFQDLHDAKVEGDVVYICRGYNSNLPRKGTVSAIDARTGDVMWRSENLVCGGVLALVGDYVVTGYGAVDRPYAVKLLRRADGKTVQTIPHYGAALDFVVDGDEVTMRTFVDQLTYRLSP